MAPRIGWQIDPFGHSATQARLFAEMGFDAMFFARADYQDKARRVASREMEFLWQPHYKNVFRRVEIFTHILYSHYHEPEGFCFGDEDPRCASDEPIIDNPKSYDFNVERRAEELRKWILHMRRHYRTNNLFMVWGRDFQYQNAHKVFKNTNKLLEHFNEKYNDI